MGQVVCTQEILATAEHVWAVIADVTRLPEWAYEGYPSHPVEGKYGSEQTEGVGTIWIGVSADNQIATNEVTVWEQEKKLAYELRKMENVSTQISMTNTLVLEPFDNGTRLTWTVDWEPKGGFFSSLMLRFTGSATLEDMMWSSLEKLKQVIENEAKG